MYFSPVAFKLTDREVLIFGSYEGHSFDPETEEFKELPNQPKKFFSDRGTMVFEKHRNAIYCLGCEHDPIRIYSDQKSTTFTERLCCKTKQKQREE